MIPGLSIQIHYRSVHSIRGSSISLFIRNGFHDPKKNIQDRQRHSSFSITIMHNHHLVGDVVDGSLEIIVDSSLLGLSLVCSVCGCNRNQGICKRISVRFQCNEIVLNRGGKARPQRTGTSWPRVPGLRPRCHG